MPYGFEQVRELTNIQILRPAAILYVLGLMMVSLCSEYYQFMLAQGVLMGSAVAFLQFPAFAIVAQYFDKKRAAAMGMVAAGSSVGGIIFPIVLSHLLNGTNASFGWSMRIVGFIILPFMVLPCFMIRPRVPPRKATIFIGAAWKDKKYVLLIVGMFFMMMGMWTPVFYTPTYAVTRGMSTTLAGNLLAIINASSTFGRIIPGILADKFGRINLFGFAGVGTGIMVFCLNEPKANAGIIVYCVFFGFVSGTIISSASAAISLCTKDPRNLGTYMGMGMGLAAFAVLAGPPISGALFAKYGGFSQVSVFGGTASMLGGLIVLASKLVTEEGLFGKV
jgi:MFS family permease